jgi:hypothetical protein
MNQKRKIEKAVKKLSLSEAEDADDLYWSQRSAEERLQYLIDVRETFFGDDADEAGVINKVVFKRSLHEETC